MKHFLIPVLFVIMIAPPIAAQINTRVADEEQGQRVAGEEHQQRRDQHEHRQIVAGEEHRQRQDEHQHRQIVAGEEHRQRRDEHQHGRVAGEEHQQRQNEHQHRQIVAGEEPYQPQNEQQHTQAVAGEEHQQRQDEHQHRQIVAGEEHQQRQNERRQRRTENQQKREILALIDNYSMARETQDTVLLKSILTSDIDQLVSSGEWRYGISGAMKGMVQSTAGNPGTRKLIVENIRLLNAENGIADARYEIQNADGTIRKMWSAFIVVYREKSWKITAIRNMLPAGQ